MKAGYTLLTDLHAQGALQATADDGCLISLDIRHTQESYPIVPVRLAVSKETEVVGKMKWIPWPLKLAWYCTPAM